jgi:hypothetical protein
MLTQPRSAIEPASSPSTTLFEYDRYEAEADALGRRYRANVPFPHLTFEGFLPPLVAQKLASEFPTQANDHWVQYRHVNENKASTDRWEDFPPLIGDVIRELNSDRFLALVRTLTGIPDLIADPDIDGGGMHEAWTGGFLNVHTDFTMHRHRPNWRRRCNLILYLNENWDPAWGGAIELWEAGMARRSGSLPCHLNRALLFDTPNALHGFPDPLTCPPDRSRKSIQLYYYTVDAVEAAAPQATTYYARPEDPPIKRMLVRLDNRFLRLYAWMKRTFGISDTLVTRIVNLLGLGKTR